MARRLRIDDDGELDIETINRKRTLSGTSFDRLSLHTTSRRPVSSHPASSTSDQSPLQSTYPPIVKRHCTSLEQDRQKHSTVTIADAVDGYHLFSNQPNLRRLDFSFPTWAVLTDCTSFQVQHLLIPMHAVHVYRF
jgi:hypothetical protein